MLSRKSKLLFKMRLDSNFRSGFVFTYTTSRFEGDVMVHMKQTWYLAGILFVALLLRIVYIINMLGGI